MGATADLFLFVATWHWFQRSPSSSRRMLLCSIASHFTYVVLYFLNCMLFPPLPKVCGLFLNTCAAFFALQYFSQTARQHNQADQAREKCH
jgi:hypothetical protein